MSIHDWTRVLPGTYHDFHVAWGVHLAEALNGALLPSTHYCQLEQHAGCRLDDVVVRPPSPETQVVDDEHSHYRRSRRTLAIRTVASRRLVAVIEIISPVNKDCTQHLNDFVEKVWAALDRGIHIVIVDLFPPSHPDEQGMHQAIWEPRYGEAGVDFSPNQPLTLTSYSAMGTGCVEPCAVGDSLPTVPLFLKNDYYVYLPFEETYLQAYRGVPAFVKEILEGRAPTEMQS